MMLLLMVMIKLTYAQPIDTLRGTIVVRKPPIKEMADTNQIMHAPQPIVKQWAWYTADYCGHDLELVAKGKKNRTAPFVGWEQVGDRPHFKIGVYSHPLNFSWRTGAFFRLDSKQGENSLNLFFQKSLWRNPVEGHQHQVLAAGVQAGFFTNNARGFSFQPYFAFSIPDNCILNRLQFNMGYAFIEAETDNGAKRNAAQLGIWIYL